MSHTLYDDDILLWSERQADLLRRHAAGERLNEAVDWSNVIEEIEDVGRSEFNACESLLEQALLHLLKIQLQPNSREVPHWRGEVIAFLGRAWRHYTPSVRRRIDLASMYRLCIRQLRESRAEPQRWPSECPFAAENLLQPEPDLAALLAKLGST